jgi:4-hydroxy-tetrahydrodipicolinate synthase
VGKRAKAFSPVGVIPACLMPFTADLEIDEAAYRRHLSDLAAVPGVTGVTINGHAAEVHALNFNEQMSAVAHAVEEIGDLMPVIVGVFTESSREAARIVRQAEIEGASAYLVFPPGSLGFGGQARPEMALAHFSAIASATDLPLILFQYPVSSDLAYPLETLIRLCEEITSIKAIKDWSGDPVRHERNIRTLHGLNRSVNVLTTHSMWLLPSLVLGARGILSGAGSVVAGLQSALWNAVQRADLRAAQEIYERLRYTVEAFYADPFVDAHNRMKEALVLLGRWREAHVRPPLLKLPASEIKRIAGLLWQAGLLEESLTASSWANLGRSRDEGRDHRLQRHS